MELELADNYALSDVDPTDFYLVHPDTGEYVREDYFDSLPQHMFEAVMDQQPGMSGLFGNRDARRERRENRKSMRGRKKEARTARTEARTAIKEQTARGERERGVDLMMRKGQQIGKTIEQFAPGGGSDKDLTVDIGPPPKTKITDEAWFWPVVIGGGALVAFMMFKK